MKVVYCLFIVILAEIVFCKDGNMGTHHDAIIRQSPLLGGLLDPVLALLQTLLSSVVALLRGLLGNI
ncbi:hypothetical protein CHUAL_008266 [Chamberlinius hualienensis]